MTEENILLNAGDIIVLIEHCYVNTDWNFEFLKFLFIFIEKTW